MSNWQKHLEAGVYEWLIHSRNTYLVISDAEGKLVFINTLYKETFLGASSQDSLLNFKDLVPDEDEKFLEKLMQQCLETKPKTPFQFISRNKIEGTKRYKSVKWECLAIDGEKEPLLIYLGHNVVAVEEEKVANEHYRRTLNQLIDNLQIGVVVQDENTSILLSNSKAEELLGLTKDQLYGRTVYDENWRIIHQDGTEFLAEDLPAAQAIVTRERQHDVIMGVFNPRKDQFMWLQVDANPEFDEEGNLDRVVTTFIDISQRKKQEEILKDALKEKITLLSEVHHRVKNNLAIVSGLLELQSMEMESEFKLPFQRSINRIHSIAMVHELMYETERLSSVNIKNYLDQLIPAIHRTMQIKNDVQVNLEMEDYMLNINQAIPLGLLINELLTNSFKYAFLKIFDGKIDIKMTGENNFLTFTYRDNGPGFRDGNDFYNSSSLGLSLIHAQLEQLHADFEVVTEGKFVLEFTFEISGRGSHSNI